MYCDCNNANVAIKSKPDLITLDKEYGWVLSWINITEEKGYSQIHNYAIPIQYCPFCGKSLTWSNNYAEPIQNTDIH